MSKIKSFSVDIGDAFYIDHNSDNFSIIDCYLPDDRKDEIVKEIKKIKSRKIVTRFISTHPDQDHIGGLKFLDEKISIENFYCVENKVNKKNPTEDFKHYCLLRDSSKAFFIKKGCKRKWMNDSSEERGSSGINILWPDIENNHFKEALEIAEQDGKPNNISAIIKYSLEDGVKVLWFGDLESEFMKGIEDDVSIPKADIIFAPHHGRGSGKIPEKWLKKIDPKIIIIGEAPSEDLNYYDGYNTITQNSAGDITLNCLDKKVHIFVSNPDYEVDFLNNENITEDYYYLGTLYL